MLRYSILIFGEYLIVMLFLIFWFSHINCLILSNIVLACLLSYYCSVQLGTNAWKKKNLTGKERFVELDKEDSTKFGVDGMEYNDVSFMLILWRFTVRVIKRIF